MTSGWGNLKQEYVYGTDVTDSGSLSTDNFKTNLENLTIYPNRFSD